MSSQVAEKSDHTSTLLIVKKFHQKYNSVMQYDAFQVHITRLSPFLKLTNFLSHQHNGIILGIWWLYSSVSILPLTFPIIFLKLKKLKTFQ